MATFRFSLALALSGLGFGLAAPASASVAVPIGTVLIGGLFDTGVDDSGNALVGGDGVTDTHYVIVASTVTGITAGGNAVTYKHPAYVADSATSRWISHSKTGSPGNGITTFRLTFDLSGLDAGTAVITGKNAADNGGRIYLNGVDTGVSLGSYSSLVAFTIGSGFKAGINTLDFAVEDSGPPLGLRIDSLQGTAQIAAVPVPASLLLLAPALAVLGASRRKARA